VRFYPTRLEYTIAGIGFRKNMLGWAWFVGFRWTQFIDLRLDGHASEGWHPGKRSVHKQCAIW